MDRARLITDLSIIICFPFLSGKCQLPQHNPCFLDVCTQTWETSSISYGKSVDQIFCWVIDTFVQNMLLKNSSFLKLLHPNISVHILHTIFLFFIYLIRSFFFGSQEVL